MKIYNQSQQEYNQFDCVDVIKLCARFVVAVRVAAVGGVI